MNFACTASINASAHDDLLHWRLQWKFVSFMKMRMLRPH